MAYAMTFKPDFLERCKRMSGLKSNAAFAGAIGVSESVLSKAMHTNIVSPTMIVGFNRAFGFTPGEIAEVTEIPDKDLKHEEVECWSRGLSVFGRACSPMRQLAGVIW